MLLINSKMLDELEGQIINQSLDAEYASEVVPWLQNQAVMLIGMVRQLKAERSKLLQEGVERVKELTEQREKLQAWADKIAKCG